ncbi:hypothetical protein FACS1894124_5080 [Spirochaetia bacterium]|nr:hypothetical protein FACS1894124_5080 [Spirochaetia bacterium]
MNIEQRYLSCLLAGGNPENITLSPSQERLHEEIKKIKAIGLHVITKGTIPGTDHLYETEASPLLTKTYSDQIREAQKKQSLKKRISSLSGNMSSGEIITTLRDELDKLSAETGRNEIKSAAEIKETAYQNTEFIIDKILPVGLMVFFAAPKIGKSWLLLKMAECITLGFPFLGYPVKKVPVLYYTLEDNIRRCKYRLNKLGSGFSSNLYFSETSNETQGVMADIRTTKARVIIIDTFGAFNSGNAMDGNDYGETTRVIREIKEIADVMQVSIILVHHSNKNEGTGDWMAGVMGSQGIIGAGDSIMRIIRKRDETSGKLLIAGRDTGDMYLDLLFQDGEWVRA